MKPTVMKLPLPSCLRGLLTVGVLSGIVRLEVGAVANKIAGIILLMADDVRVHGKDVGCLSISCIAG